MNLRKGEDMKILIVEDDFVSRLLLKEILNIYGATETVVNGVEAVEAVRIALEANQPYDLICLDIMMPQMDGQEALKKIRSLEESLGIRSSNGSKIIIITALDDPKNVFTAFYGLCDTYLVKPIAREDLVKKLRELNLIV